MLVRQIVVYTIAASAWIGVPTAHALPTYSAIYAFGDSLSDAGNLFLLSANPANGIPHQPLAPYSNGRFSNGNTWVQDVSLSLGLGALTPSLAGGTDYAYGGARTGTTTLGMGTFIDLPSQLAQFNAGHASAPSTALYTLSIGANDIFAALTAIGNGTLSISQAQAALSTAAANVASFASALRGEGAKTLVLYDVPDLSLTPRFNTARRRRGCWPRAWRCSSTRRCRRTWYPWWRRG